MLLKKRMFVCADMLTECCIIKSNCVVLARAWSYDYSAIGVLIKLN